MNCCSSIEVMWISKQIEQKYYLFNINRTNESNGVEFTCCDSSEFWHVRYTNDQILLIFRELNPLIQGEKDELISDIVGLFNPDRTEVQWKISMVDDHLFLNLTGELEILPFLFNITFEPASSKTFYHNMMYPLLSTIKILEMQTNFLCDSLKKKDLEISEYKLNGVTLSRKNLETPQFQEEALKELYTKYLKVFVNSDFEKLADESLIKHLNEITKNQKQQSGNFNTESIFQSSSPKKIKSENSVDLSGENSTQPTFKNTNAGDVKPVLINNAFLNAAPVSRKPKTVKLLKNL